jgi:hypothetical protein
MMLTVRNRVSKSPSLNYSIAACELCEATCLESIQPGRTGWRARDAALAIAHGLGWTDRTVPDYSPRRRRMQWTVQLVCPDCQAKLAAAAAALATLNGLLEVLESTPDRPAPPPGSRPGPTGPFHPN